MKRYSRSLVLIAIIVLFNLKPMLAQNSPDTVFTKDPGNKDLVAFEVVDAKGQLLSAGMLLQGKKEGVCRQYNTKNIINSIQEFHDGNADGIYLKFAENGSLEAEENFKQGVLDGRKIVYRFGGIIKSSEIYKNGKVDGVKTVYYDNGFKQEVASYKNGLRDGISTWYNQSEVITIQYTYKAGLLEGTAKAFFFSSKLQSEGDYLNDQENGEWKYYDETGKQVKSVFYKNGKIVKEVPTK